MYKTEPGQTHRRLFCSGRSLRTKHVNRLSTVMRETVAQRNRADVPCRRVCACEVHLILGVLGSSSLRRFCLPCPLGNHPMRFTRAAPRRVCPIGQGKEVDSDGSSTGGPGAFLGGSCEWRWGMPDGHHRCTGRAHVSDARPDWKEALISIPLRDDAWVISKIDDVPFVRLEGMPTRVFAVDSLADGFAATDSGDHFTRLFGSRRRTPETHCLWPAGDLPDARRDKNHRRGTSQTCGMAHLKTLSLAATEISDTGAWRCWVMCRRCDISTCGRRSLPMCRCCRWLARQLGAFLTFPGRSWTEPG